jgi:hypothetical protein
MGTNKPIYLIIDRQKKYYIRKYLSKVEELTNIRQNTLSKHFNNSNLEYKNDNWHVIIVRNVDLTSNSRGNTHNFINSHQEWE